MTKEQALETLFDNAENGMVDVGDVKMVFDEMRQDDPAETNAGIMDESCLKGRVEYNDNVYVAEKPQIKSISKDGEITFGGFREYGRSIL